MPASLALVWDQVGTKKYEAGVSKGVLFVQKTDGTYEAGVAWNGLVSVTESPDGAEANAVYADNQKYLNLMSAEDFKASIEAFMFPNEFSICDGSIEIADGVSVGQQKRRAFALSYRTGVGNDTDGLEYGYKIHIIYGCMATPSERAYTTVNDSPEAMNLSWDLTTTPVDIPGFKPSAHIVIDSTKTSPAKMLAFETLLYGATAVAPAIQMPAAIITAFSPNAIPYAAG